MKDEDPAQCLNHKINVLSENLNLVQQFFVEKAAQNEQQKKLIDDEQKTIHELLRRWKIMEEEIGSLVTPPPRPPSSQTYVNSNGPASSPVSISLVSVSSPSMSPQYSWPAPREKTGSTRPSVYISPVPTGSSSPGRSPKSRESHASYRRQLSLTPSKQNSQYPVLPKKRKLQQIVFSPTTSTGAAAGVPLAHTVFPPQMQSQEDSVDSGPVEMILNVDPGSVNVSMPSVATPDEIKFESSNPMANNNNQMEYQQNDGTSGDNSDSSDKDTHFRQEDLANLAVNYSGSRQVEPEDLTQAKAMEMRDNESRSATGANEMSKSENEEVQPPKLAPAAAASKNATASPSSRRLPFPIQSQGSRKSSRTIRPSWKLNSSAESLPLNSPERAVREERERRDRDRSSSSTPSSSSKKRKRPPANKTLVLDEPHPPVLTNQFEISEDKLEDDIKPLLEGYPRNLKCHKCDKMFATQHGLRYHIESHLQLKPFTCSICHKSFGQKSTLTRHEATTHTKVKAHVCPLCKKSFSSQSELKSHRGRHEAKRNSCPVCNRGFIDKRYFKLHVKLCTAKNVEDEANANENGEDDGGGGGPSTSTSGSGSGSRANAHALFQCANCQKNYRDPNYFKKHVSLCMKE